MNDPNQHESTSDSPATTIGFSNPIYGRLPNRPIPKPRLSKQRQRNNEANEQLPTPSPLLKSESSIRLNDLYMTQQLLEEINTLTISLQRNLSANRPLAPSKPSEPSKPSKPSRAPNDASARHTDDDDYDDVHLEAPDHQHQRPEQEAQMEKPAAELPRQPQQVEHAQKLKEQPQRVTRKKKIIVHTAQIFRLPSITDTNAAPSTTMVPTEDDEDLYVNNDGTDHAQRSTGHDPEKSAPSNDYTSKQRTTNSNDSGVYLMVTSKSASDNRNEFKSIAASEPLKSPPMSPISSEPPELPPRTIKRPQPPCSDIIPTGMDAVKSYEENLDIEHLHVDTLSLQRSGYLWKTGPNYKCFKNRWCILYRHHQNYYDANLSYYFNRSSISTSLSGKIVLDEIEFIGICESVPLKTRLPKIEKPVGAKTCADTTAADHHHHQPQQHQSSSLCFFEIGVRSRQGRVYLFAARTDLDRQQWLHAFVQAITLHAFKNKEIYHCGFIMVKFSITAEWQKCFALLTADRFFYLFELTNPADDPAAEGGHAGNSGGLTLDCARYHIFNLRKTIKLTRFDDHRGSIDAQSPLLLPQKPLAAPPSHKPFASSPPAPSTATFKYGFSLTQNGGNVIYLASQFEHHIHHWYCSLIRFWSVPKRPPEKLVFAEQYLSKDNVPIAMDKCLKFLDTFNTQGMNLFASSVQDSLGDDNPLMVRHIEPVAEAIQCDRDSPQPQPQQPLKPLDLWTQQQLLTQLKYDTWNVHLLPQKFNPLQIIQIILLYLRSMNECLFTDRLLPYWIELSELFDGDGHNDCDRNFDTNCDTTDADGQIDEQIKRLLRFMPQVNYALLRRLIIYLANTTLNQANRRSNDPEGHPEGPEEGHQGHELSDALCKSLFFTHRKTPTISIAVSRKILLRLVRHHINIFNITKDELEKELQIKRVVNLIIDQNRKQKQQQTAQAQAAQALPKGKASLKKALRSAASNSKPQTQPQQVQPSQPQPKVPALPAVQRMRNMDNTNLFKPQHHHHRNQRIASLIITIKVYLYQPELKQMNVNVHINRSTTANDILEMILEKIKLDSDNRLDSDYILKNYSLFESLCQKRLERIICGYEKILSLILCWSQWPPQWSTDSLIIMKPTEHILRYYFEQNSIEFHPYNNNDKQRTQPVFRVPNLNFVRSPQQNATAGGGGHNGQPQQPQKSSIPIANVVPIMLMSIVRYCHTSDQHTVKHILAEFSSTKLFLYCKETHHLLYQYDLDALYWYVGCESGNIFRTQPTVKCRKIVRDDDTDDAAMNRPPQSPRSLTQPASSLASGTSSSSASAASSGSSESSASSAIATATAAMPAITFIEKNRYKHRQSNDRRNFGHTLLFNTWIELDQWIKGLLEASFYDELLYDM